LCPWRQKTELGKNIANPDASEDAASKRIRFLPGTLRRNTLANPVSAHGFPADD